MSSSPVLRRAGGAALAAAAAVVVLAVAVAAHAAARSDTSIAVSPRVLVAAPERSTVDFPGVSRARAGRPLPRGHTAVGRDVRIARGREVAHAALRMTCPRGSAWRSGAAAGELLLTVLDRVVSGKRAVLVMASVDTSRTAAGEAAEGTIWALCR